MTIAKQLMRLAFLMAIICVARPVFAQQQDETPTPQEEREPMAGQMEGQMMGQSPEMQEMARAMKSMADMCQMMMQREMQMRPYLMTAVGVAGLLLTIAFILFIILEVQWIRFWNLRIQTERRQLG